MSRELRKMGYRKRHITVPSRNSKKFPARLKDIARQKGIDADKIEIWFADEALIGQKNKITRRWAKRGWRM